MAGRINALKPGPVGAVAMLGALKPPVLASSVVLVLANLLPLGGALLGYWSSYEIMLLFWAENVVIGVMQVLRMVSVLVLRRVLEMLVMIPFFIIHYGIFTLAHGVLLAELIGPPGNSPGKVIALLLSPDGLLWAVLALSASHVLSFALNFLGDGEWRRVEPSRLMFQPYRRVVVLHLVIICGGMVVMWMGDAIYAVAMLVVVKLALDLHAHLAEHRVARAA